jgi:hypothetical protein
MKTKQWNLLKLFKEGGRGQGRMTEWVNLIKIPCKHMGRCCNEILVISNIR